MSDDFPRRRRLSNTGSPRRSGGNGNGMNPWVLTILAAVVVIAGGWFLGQALARIFNGAPKTKEIAQLPTTLPSVTPVPSPSPVPTFSVAPTLTPKPTEKPTPEKTSSPGPSPSPTVSAQPTPTPAQTEQPAAAPTAAATVAPTPAPSATASQRHTQPIGRRPEPTATPAPAPESPAARVVRAYINALRRGDPGTASSYLGNGVPDEQFIDSATRITSISETRNSDGSFKVSVDMSTAQGEYYETFTVASDKILDKTAIKP